ncbi:MAG: hypothetical protein WD355_11425 [Balneolaceae bacterium]
MISKTLVFLSNHRYFLYISLLLLTVITLSLTLLPPDKISPDHRLLQYDKLGHSIMFGSWTLLLGLTRIVSNLRPLPLLPIFLTGSIFGITVEILQEILPVDRQADPYDALADIAGCLIAIFILNIITKYSKILYRSMEQ